MNGEYQLKADEGVKPDPICLDGCVYTKLGDPHMEEYCFGEAEQAGASVLPTSCPATSTLVSFWTTGEDVSTTPTVSLLTDEVGTAEEISISNLREETEKQLADLDGLINNVDSSPALKIELEKLKDLLNGLSGSLGGFESGRMKRSLSVLKCSDLDVIIDAYEQVNALLQDILSQMKLIGTNTGNSDLNTFIATTTEMFSEIDIGPHLHWFKQLQTQTGCAVQATTPNSPTATVTSTPT